jgi:protein TonB
MKTFLITTLLFLSFTCIRAQTTLPPPPPTPPDVDRTGKADSSKLLPTNQNPEFPGGLNEFYKFLSNGIKYPLNARKNKIHGRVDISFIVETDGSLTDIKVSRSVSPDLDDEALRLIKSSPKWKPGVKNGKLIPVKYSVPINFSL